MYNVAMRIVKDTALAEDCMQEGFIAAFEKLETFKGNATFGSWLKRIVVNRSIAAYHKSKKFVPLPEFNEIEHEVETQTNGEEYSNLKVLQILECMEGIHSKYRQILNLHYIEGYDYEEICGILNISNANCRTLISRAKESLRKKLKMIQKLEHN